MKIICKILAFGTIALSVGGCDLTMLPEHELSPEQYFQNESDLTLWSNQFYNDNLESADIGINDADDKIDNDDRAVCGNLTPSITYAFNFSLGWKGLELSAQFQGVADVKTYLSGNLAAPFWNGAGVLKEWATDAWTPENHNSRLPILHTATGAPEMHDYKNTQWLYDASYLRCKQLQLSYTLPKRWISKLGMSQCQIFVNGENLFTISPLKMFDPEIDLSSTNLMQYPSLRTINFGFNITF